MTEGPTIGNGQNGSVSFVLSAGSSPSATIQTETKLGTLVLPTRESAGAGIYQITFDETNTIVYSNESVNNSQENVLSTTIPASITLEAICRPNIASCAWDAVEGASTYHYSVTDVDTAKEISEGVTSSTSVNFDGAINKTYKCEVYAINECGQGPSAQATSSCSQVTTTPVPTTPVTSTPTPSRPVATNTPTPTTPSGSTPTPTQIVATPTTIVSVSTVTPSQIVEQNLTSLPPTGNPYALGAVLGGALVIIGGILLFIL
jgi:hypothetical protein